MGAGPSGSARHCPRTHGGQARAPQRDSARQGDEPSGAMVVRRGPQNHCAATCLRACGVDSEPIREHQTGPRHDNGRIVRPDTCQRPIPREIASQTLLWGRLCMVQNSSSGRASISTSSENLKQVLCQIQPDRGNLRHDRPPSWIVAIPPWHLDAVWGERLHPQRPPQAALCFVENSEYTPLAFGWFYHICACLALNAWGFVVSGFILRQRISISI